MIVLTLSFRVCMTCQSRYQGETTHVSQVQHEGGRCHDAFRWLSFPNLSNLCLRKFELNLITFVMQGLWLCAWDECMHAEEINAHAHYCIYLIVAYFVLIPGNIQSACWLGKRSAICDDSSDFASMRIHTFEYCWQTWWNLHSLSFLRSHTQPTHIYLLIDDESPETCVETRRII